MEAIESTASLAIKDEEANRVVAVSLAEAPKPSVHQSGHASRSSQVSGSNHGLALKTLWLKTDREALRSSPVIQKGSSDGGSIYKQVNLA